MTDERLARAVTSWLEDTDAPTPDLNSSVRHAMTHVQRTRQLGRWWSLPSFGRTQASKPTLDQTSDYQPKPNPAANARTHHDHTPTIIGRTQTMFSPVKAITAGALVFAIGGVMLIAQPFDQQSSVPGAQDEDTDLAGVTVTVTQECVEFDPCRWTASDPRLTGTVSIVWTGNVEDLAAADAGLDAGLAWMDVGFEGPEGGWTGHGYILWGEPTQNFLVLSGTGANEGWQYIASSIAPPDSEGDFEYIGTLYEGELPPYPATAE